MNSPDETPAGRPDAGRARACARPEHSGDDPAPRLAAPVQEVQRLREQLERLERREQQRIAELRRLHERRLRAVRESITYRIGDEIVRAARSPRRMLRLPATLYRLYRQRRRIAGEAGAPLPEPTSGARRDVWAAAILDEFSHRCLAPELRLVPVTKGAWEREVADTEPDLLLVESAWQGNGGQWTHALSAFAEQDPNRIAGLLRLCRAHGIPTVFWNKEDPVNFEVFLDAAREFDAVLTTDEAAVPWYREALGHARVHVMPFAAQPALHNPIGSRGEQMLPRVCFAGSWRGDKYELRAQDFHVLLDPPLELGVLDVYDRLAGTDRAFPPPYRAAVRGALSYEEMLGAYRRYAAFLNVNSVADSPTMFSRRVFELLACATPVISTPSEGIERMLGDVVLTTTSAAQTRRIVEELVGDRERRDRLGQRGYRKVMAEHTYARRVDDLLSRLNVPSAPRSRPLVSVLCASNRPGRVEETFEAYARQTYEERELVFVMNADGFDQAKVHRLSDRLPNVTVLSLDEDASLADCLNEALRCAKGDYFAKFDDDDYYGRDYLTDMLLAFEYADAAIVGKHSCYAYLEAQDVTVLRFPGREFSYVNHVAGSSIVADRSALDGICFAGRERGTDSRFLRRCREAGLRIFAADRFNHAFVRHAAEHTWGVSDREFLKGCVKVADGFAEHVIVA